MQPQWQSNPLVMANETARQSQMVMGGDSGPDQQSLLAVIDRQSRDLQRLAREVDQLTRDVDQKGRDHARLTQEIDDLRRQLAAPAREQEQILPASLMGAATTTTADQWDTYQDDSGHTYYYNSVTGETSWSKPTV
jgi:hypothetical protein